MAIVGSLHTVREEETMTDAEYLRYVAKVYLSRSIGKRLIEIAERLKKMEKELERLMDVVHETDYDSIMLALGRKP